MLPCVQTIALAAHRMMFNTILNYKNLNEKTPAAK
jgi:hypothetical protein